MDSSDSVESKGRSWSLVLPVPVPAEIAERKFFPEFLTQLYP